jgi:hypothetical protein
MCDVELTQVEPEENEQTLPYGLDHWWRGKQVYYTNGGADEAKQNMIAAISYASDGPPPTNDVPFWRRPR